MSTWRGSPSNGVPSWLRMSQNMRADDVVALGPRQQLEGVGVGPGEHVALLHPAEAVDGRAVEVHALLEGVLELGGRDGDRLELAEHVGEPQADEADPTLLDRAQHVVLLAFHAPMSGIGSRPTGVQSEAGVQFTHRSQTGNGRETASLEA